jgi:integrase
MAKPIRFTPKNSASGWRINIPAKISETGKRQQLFFRTQKLALAAADDLKKKVEIFGVQTRAIAPTLAEQATAAAALLKPYGIDLLEAARIVAGMRERETASRTLSEAAVAWLASCAGLRPRTVVNYKITADRLEKALGDRLLATITAEELQAVIAPAGRAGAACMGEIRNAKAFWRYSAKKGWCEVKTFGGVEAPKSGRDSKEIAILTPAEAETLLRTAEAHFPQAVPLFALRLFAGIRVEEITRMEAEHVTADGIDLPASVTKKGRRRHITPSKTLAAWLEKHPFAPCSNWRETSAAVRRLAGWDVVSAILKERVRVKTMEELPKPTLGRWPQNALRHSHASYAVASGVPLESLLFEFGHAGSPTLLRQHYVGRASKKQALEFFTIAPEGVEIPTMEAVA